MTYPIPYLKTIMVLVMLSLPVGLGVNASYFITSAIRKKRISTNYLGLIISYALVFLVSVLTGVVHPADIRFDADLPWAAAAVAAGCLCIGVEYLVGVFLTFFSAGRWVFQISVHSVYSDTEKISLGDILAVVVFVILEELIFRFALMSVLSGFSLPAAVMIGIAVCIFALNHVHWGLISFIQKLFSGCIFVLLYIVFNRNILIPVLAHLTQNCVLLWLSRIGKKANHE